MKYADIVRLSLKEGENVGYILVDGLYEVAQIKPSVAGEFHIDMAEGCSLINTGTYSDKLGDDGKPLGINQLFFYGTGDKTQAQIYVDSGSISLNAGTAIYLSKTGQGVTFAKGTSLTLNSQELKVRALLLEM